MKVVIRDVEALKAVSPGALSAYARAAGWSKSETYGDFSDVYVARGRPEIILPRTERLGDYADAVSRLIEIFAKTAETDELSLYRDLVTADRDVIRVRAAGGHDGAVALHDGLALLRGAHDMMLAAACSLRNPRPAYRAGSNREAGNYVRRVRVGQTEQGGFAVTLLPPVVAPPLRVGPVGGGEPAEDPLERAMTRRMVGALTAAKTAIERTIGGVGRAFVEAVEEGVSANLCDALVTLIEPFPGLDVSVTWARTLPRPVAREVVRFGEADAPILREAARVFRNLEPRPAQRLVGVVQRLKRGNAETVGMIGLRTSIDGRNQLVRADLPQSDYERAIRARQEKTPVCMEGDLDRIGQRWRLLNARVVDVIRDEDPAGDSA